MSDGTWVNSSGIKSIIVMIKKCLQNQRKKVEFQWWKMLCTHVQFSNMSFSSAGSSVEYSITWQNSITLCVTIELMRSQHEQRCYSMAAVVVVRCSPIGRCCQRVSLKIWMFEYSLQHSLALLNSSMIKY